MSCHRHWKCLAIVFNVFILLFVVNPSISYAESFYGFDKVIHGPTESINYNGKPVKFNANISGGLIVVDMPDSSGTCSGTYRFTWKFNNDITKLQAGKKYSVAARGERVKGDCKKNSTAMHLRSSLSGSNLADKNVSKNRDKNINITYAKTNAITAYPTTSTNSVSVTIETKSSNISNTPGYDYFTLTFSFSSYPYSSKSKSYKYEVVYLYKKTTVSASTSGPVNCPAVFRLGIQLGMLNMATYRNEDAGFCVKILGYAISAAKGSGCVSADKLVNLRNRMRGTKNSKYFSGEVIALQAEYVKLVDSNCGSK